MTPSSSSSPSPWQTYLDTGIVMAAIVLTLLLNWNWFNIIWFAGLIVVILRPIPSRQLGILTVATTMLIPVVHRLHHDALAENQIAVSAFFLFLFTILSLLRELWYSRNSK
jgi:hypothetical protein